MGPEADAALPTLVSLLNDKRHVLAIAFTLERMKPGRLHELPVADREKAAAALYQAAIAPEEPGLEGWCVRTLTTLHEVSDPYLLKLLRSDDPTHQMLAAASLADVKLPKATLQPELLRLARSENRQVQLQAIRALGTIGEPTSETKAVLLDILNNPPPLPAGPSDEAPAFYVWQRVADAAARALSRFGPEVIDDLLPLVLSENFARRRQASVALQALGEPAIPRLIELLHHEDERVAHIAGRTLISIGRAAVSELTRCLSSDDKQVARIASLALLLIRGGGKDALSDFRQIPEGAQAALPSLFEIARSKEPERVRILAVRAALEIDPKSRSHEAVLSTIPIMIEVLHNAHMRDQAEAAAALALIGPTAREALPALRNRLERTGQLGDPVTVHLRNELTKAIDAVSLSN